MNKPLPWSKCDPASVKQNFDACTIQILCCRFWWLRHWEHRELSFPYWRIYYNDKAGAYLNSGGEVIPITPDNIYIIPPNTSYSSYLLDNPLPTNTDILEGGAICSDSSLSELGVVNHLFIHFNVDISTYDSPREVHILPLDSLTLSAINSISNYLVEEHVDFDLQITCLIKSLINLLLYRVDIGIHSTPKLDHRIERTVRYIESNLASSLSNNHLAEHAYMSCNTFIRLFKNQIGQTVQQYVLRRRIDHACSLLHHTTMSIDEIAFKVGFSNRFHFSRQFLNIVNIPPAQYRKYGG